VNKGVGCVSCHGRVDEMAAVEKVHPLSMSWCLDCHRSPEKHLRPVEEVTNMTEAPAAGGGGHQHDLEARG
jgi:menaquinone reductase, multiheme cytochrome c subunit